MKRQGPFASPIGFGLTVALFLGLGFSLARDRGLAFSPGPVTAKNKPGVVLGGFSSHADFEKACQNCHYPIRASMAEMCVVCHTQVVEQINRMDGIHGKIPNVSRCYDCHPEHRGRDYDPTQAAYLVFDHTITNFSLVWHQIDYNATPLACEGCHTDPDYSIVVSETCAGCHGDHDQIFIQEHIQYYGVDCLVCHDGRDAMIDFDHSNTDFPLDGEHLQVKCADCHPQSRLEETPLECEQCHVEPLAHQGVFDLFCESCHTPRGWSPASFEGKSFEHMTTTGFSLGRHQVDYTGQVLNCRVCHGEDYSSFYSQVCIDCHNQADAIFMGEHLERFGFVCLDCHDGVDRLSDFDHDEFFPLDGSHASVDCEGCHEGRIFRGTPSECSQCHAEPEIHAGVFGLQCQYCHDSLDWLPANLRVHVFPLDHGGQGIQDCLLCHVGNYVEYTCYGCHDHQPEAIAQSHNRAGILPQDLPDCAACHPFGQLSEASP